ncbi:MAG: KpsF/GutQ family sugar-phosphate isomerase [Sulfurimonas sp.]|jgi:arabinose-5-phosphate isomerase|nr:KpsF/GutQ family sugar-phosphate isomerase [Sulfurimonadaceae bacterium]
MNYIDIAKETLKIEAQTLLDSADTLDKSFNDAIELILKCSGKLIISGVGKSGLVGAKIAATLASTGTPSFFLHPTEALHGDLGMISRGDVVLAISYSGESEELSSILPHIKRFDIPLIGMSKDKNSTLGRYSDVFLNIRVKKEACPLNAAPTSSTTLTLAMGDAIAVALMRARDFKTDDFASFHPGGALGKRLFIKVKDIMRTDSLPIIKATSTLKEAIVAIGEGRLGTALIVDEQDTLVALASDGDIRRALMRDDFSLEDNILKYATKNPKVIDDENILASQALAIIEELKIQLLAITSKDKKVKGVLHIHTLIEKGIS